MAKRSNQKLKLLYLYKILLGSTGAGNGLTLSEISDELGKYGIRAERKTLYADIESLRLFGLDIRVRRDRRVRYYVGNHGVSAGEMKLLGDFLNSSALVSESDAQSLLRRLSDTAGRETLSLFQKNASEGLTDGRVGALENAEIFCNAILENKRMKGRYFCWNSKKQRIMQFDGRVLNFSPWHLELSGDAPIAIVTLRGEQEPVALRVDRFIDLGIISDPREGVEKVSALREGGKIDGLIGKSAPVMLRMRAKNSLADDVISRFGTNITVISNQEDFFEFSVKASADSKLYAWIFERGGEVEILAPASARDEYCKLHASSFIAGT